MSKKEKALVGVFTFLSLFLIAVYALMHHFASKKAESLIYPKGNLSDSLFVSQNNTYTDNAALPNPRELTKAPYLINLPDGDEAVSNGAVILKAADSVYVYYAEHDEETDAESLFLDSFPSAIMMNFSKTYTYAQAFESQSGYINGMGADYLFDLVSISDGVKQSSVYAAIYDLKMSDERFLTVSVVTTESGSDKFSEIKAILDAVTKTVRYDEKLDKKQQKEVKEEETKSPEEVSEVLEEPEVSKYDHRLPESEEDLLNESDIDARISRIPIEKEYEDLFVNVVVENTIPDAEVRLYDPTFTEITSLVMSEDGVVYQFQVGSVDDAMKGTYILKITHYEELGKISVEIGDAGSEGNVDQEETPENTENEGSLDESTD